MNVQRKRYAYSFPWHVVGYDTSQLDMLAIFEEDIEPSPYWFVPPEARLDEVDSDK